MFGLARERSRPPVACRQRSPRLPTSETTMTSVTHAYSRAALALVLASVSWTAGAAVQGPRSALDPITSAVINHPITTSSAEARAHFLEALREFDLGRLIDANVHFKAAVAADPDFGFAYLNVANTANSLDELKTNLALAEQNAAGASEAVRLQIQMTRKGFDNDLAGQLALGQQLVAKYPQSPRAWLALAGAQGALNENADARESMAKALELSPRLYVAHVIMGNNYIFGEPRDFTKALAHMQEAEALAPASPMRTCSSAMPTARRRISKRRARNTCGATRSSPAMPCFSSRRGTPTRSWATMRRRAPTTTPPWPSAARTRRRLT